MGYDLSDVTAITDSNKVGVTSDSAGNAALVMIYGEFLGRRYSLGSDPIVIGRSSDCAIQLSDDSVSRMHCRIIPSDTGIVLVDMDSTNGTYVNGTTVSARPLRDADRVKVGRTIFKFLSSDNIEQSYHEEIYRLKTTDGLTNTVNKRFFEQELEREVHRFFRYKRPLSMGMMDIDHFKKVNDKYGHIAGDRVLAQLALLMSSNVRREDTFARYGGEEFSLLMPEMPLDEAVQVCERLRKLVASAHFEFDGIALPITVSFGVAKATSEIAGPEDFIRLADQRLYEAKRGGRNRTEPQPPPEPAEEVLPPAEKVSTQKAGSARETEQAKKTVPGKKFESAKKAKPGKKSKSAKKAKPGKKSKSAKKAKPGKKSESAQKAKPGSKRSSP